MKSNIGRFALLAIAVGLPYQALSQEVTLYGRLDVNITKFRDSALELTQASTSRWGLLGRSDLAAGWRTEFQLESGFRSDTGALSGGLFARESWLGLSHETFGLFRLGRSLTPNQRVSVNYDPNNTDSIGTFGPSGLMLSQPALSRFSNGVFYETPKIGGFSVFAAYQLDEANDKTDDSATSVRLRFVTGEFDASLAHAELSAGNRVTSIGANYRLPNVRPMVQWHSGRRNGERRSHWLVGAVIAAPVGEVRVARLAENDRSPQSVDRRLASLGYDYPLSKRSLIYATIVRDRVSAAAARHGMEFGLRHNF